MACGPSAAISTGAKSSAKDATATCPECRPRICEATTCCYRTGSSTPQLTEMLLVRVTEGGVYSARGFSLALDRACLALIYNPGS